MRTTLLITLLASSLVTACAAEEPVVDELAGETDQDGEAGKGDTADAFTYFQVTPDKRACSLNSTCGGFFVSRVNRASTTCTRGVTAARCYVGSIDWSGTAMPASVAKSYEERLRAGESILIRGDLVPDELDRGTSLGATEVWVPGSETGTIDGVFVIAKDNGLRCITAPCPSIGETRLNANREANISSIDLTPSGADQETIDRAYNGMYDAGVILVGDREYGARSAKIRTGNQFWTKAPVPLH